MKIQALAATMLGTMILASTILASTASAQTFIRDSGNGTGNTINAGGGFGRTQIRNSGNGNYNMMNAGGGFGRTEIRNSGNGDYNTINAGGGFGRTASRHSGSFRSARVGGGSYHQVNTFYGPAPTQSCSHSVRSNGYSQRTAVGQPVFQSSRQRSPRLSLAGLPPINVNVIKNSGNGTGNAINLPGGRNGQSGLNLNLISNSANGTGNSINLGGGFPR